MFHVKHFLLCDLARRRKGFFTSRFTRNRTVENCGSGWPKRRNHRRNGRWQGVPKAGNVSRQHGKISLSEAALGRSGARSVHAGTAGKKDCPEKDADQSISSRLEEKCFTWNIAEFLWLLLKRTGTDGARQRTPGEAVRFGADGTAGGRWLLGGCDIFFGEADDGGDGFPRPEHE